MNTSTPNINCSLKPSRALFVFLLFLHALAIVCLLLVFFSIVVQILAIALVCISGIVTIRRYVLLSNKNSIVKFLTTGVSKICKIELKIGQIHNANIKYAGWVLGYFAIIVLSTNANNYKTIIAKDTLSQEQFYALRLYLRSINTLR